MGDLYGTGFMAPIMACAGTFHCTGVQYRCLHLQNWFVVQIIAFQSVGVGFCLLSDLLYCQLSWFWLGNICNEPVIGHLC